MAVSYFDDRFRHLTPESDNVMGTLSVEESEAQAEAKVVAAPSKKAGVGKTEGAETK